MTEAAIAYILLSISQVPVDTDRISPVILYEAHKASIDPLIVVALIERESSFKPHAVGKDGMDLGLMQIRRTGACLEGMSTLPHHIITTPEFNLHRGIPCLARLVKSCGGNLLKGLGKYKGVGCKSSKYGREIIKRSKIFKKKLEPINKVTIYAGY